MAEQGGQIVVRMVEPGIVKGMVEYVTHAVLDLHRDMPQFRRQQQRAEWQPRQVKLAADRRVGVLGLSSLGRAVLTQLKAMGFGCAGWISSQHHIDGVQCYSGSEGLAGFLARTEILICLLPLTEATRGFLNVKLFRRRPMEAGLIHIGGRGPQLVDVDLLAALDTGQIGDAILDVTDPEPLPAAHSFWSRARIALTQHIASMTHPLSAARVVTDNLRCFARNEPIVGPVDPVRGY